MLLRSHDLEFEVPSLLLPRHAFEMINQLDSWISPGISTVLGPGERVRILKIVDQICVRVRDPDGAGRNACKVEDGGC